MSSWLDYFIGSSQSRYAFFAIFSALVAICMAIIFTNSDISLVNRMIIVVFVLFASIFPVGISLFELTCIVNGGNSKSFNPCSTYAWVITALIVVYCFFLIIATVISMFTYKKAVTKIEVSKQTNVISSTDANTIAKNMIVQNEQKETVATAAPQVMSPPSMPVAPVAPSAPSVPLAHVAVAPSMPSASSMPSAPSFSQAMPSASSMPSAPSMPSASSFSQAMPSAPVGNGDDSYGAFAPVGSIETFKQQEKKQKKGSSEVVGYGANDGFMNYTRETFVNAPSEKKSVKKEPKTKPDFDAPKPFAKQIENFANV